ncbi:hypothetical protein CJ030_MR5G016242 [Morella rubra]|uniref:DC1 domain-containing protein n=1 Tax=Morella rubra TaxID=262757 RepID=A0A6A1VLN8_9ROSI|nr:hypothetical protein CJ030_MR5G016242 [Morella rubra]
MCGVHFKIHLLCGPLPYTIKHESQVDCLTFEDSIVEDDDPDDEYYCNTCEELRDPRVCVYYCSECKFVAHVHCVMSEVVSLLKGERGGVDMRIVGAPMTIGEDEEKEISDSLDQHDYYDEDEEEDDEDEEIKMKKTWLTKVTRSYFRFEAKKRESEMSAKVEAMLREMKALQQTVRSYDKHPISEMDVCR